MGLIPIETEIQVIEVAIRGAHVIDIRSEWTIATRVDNVQDGRRLVLTQGLLEATHQVIVVAGQWVEVTANGTARLHHHNGGGHVNDDLDIREVAPEPGATGGLGEGGTGEEDEE
jgi:hypothetical protein